MRLRSRTEKNVKVKTAITKTKQQLTTKNKRTAKINTTAGLTKTDAKARISYTAAKCSKKS